MSEGTIYRTMLYDFYSDFLTEKQKLYFDLHYNEDYSLTEISEQNGVSKQAVWDNIKHAEATLNKAEDKLGLVKKNFEIKSMLNNALSILDGLKISQDNYCSKIEEVSFILDRAMELT